MMRRGRRRGSCSHGAGRRGTRCSLARVCSSAARFSFLRPGLHSKFFGFWSPFLRSMHFPFPFLLLEAQYQPVIKNVFLWLPGAVFHCPALPFYQVFKSTLSDSAFQYGFRGENAISRRRELHLSCPGLGYLSVFVSPASVLLRPNAARHTYKYTRTHTSTAAERACYLSRGRGQPPPSPWQR